MGRGLEKCLVFQDGPGRGKATSELRKRNLVRISTEIPLSALAYHFGCKAVDLSRMIAKVTIAIYNHSLTMSLLNCVALAVLGSTFLVHIVSGIENYSSCFCRYNIPIPGKLLGPGASQPWRLGKLPGTA